MSSATDQLEGATESAQRAWLVKMSAVLGIGVPRASATADAPAVGDGQPRGFDDSGESPKPADDDPNAAQHETQVLKVGSKGPAVEHLQKKLNACGATLEVDGKFGPLTQKAVMAFQKSKGLAIDGIVGKNTWTALKAATPTPPPVPPGPVPPAPDPPSPDPPQPNPSDKRRKPPKPAPPKPVDTRPRKVIVFVGDEDNEVIDADKHPAVKLGDKTAALDTSGRANFSLPPGSYPIVITADGYGTATNTVVVSSRIKSKHFFKITKGAAISSQTDLSTSPAGSAERGKKVDLTVTVIGDGKTAPKGKVDLSFELSTGKLQPVQLTLKNGKATHQLLNLPKGTHRFEASFVPDASDISKSSDNVSFLVFENIRKLVINVTDEAKHRLENVSVKLVDEAKMLEESQLEEMTAHTNNKGVASFFVRPGRYWYETKADGFVKKEELVVVTAERQTSINVQLQKAPPQLTKINLAISPSPRAGNDQEVTLTATVTSKDPKIVPAGRVTFHKTITIDSKPVSGIVAELDLKNGAAAHKFPSLAVAWHLFHATFKPAPPAKGVEACRSDDVRYNVFNKKDEEGFNKLWKTLKPKVDDALVTAHDFRPKLQKERDAVEFYEGEVAHYVRNADFTRALPMARDLLEPASTKYLEAIKEQVKHYADLGKSVETKLKAQSSKPPEDVAYEIVENLQDDEVKHLPLDARNQLLEALLKKTPRNPHSLRAAKLLMSQRYMDPDFEKRNQEKCNALADRMKGRKDYEEARELWQQDSYSKGERLAILQKAVDDYAAVFGITSVKVVELKNSDPIDGKGVDEFGEYSHGKKAKPGQKAEDPEIRINVHPTALKKRTFDEALETVIHEMSHHQQALLAEQADSLPKTHPDYNQAQAFKLNDPSSNGFYVEDGSPPPETKGSEYFTQPEENHSRTNGAIIARAKIGQK